jgi:prefoldin subunit 5
MKPDIFYTTKTIIQVAIVSGLLLQSCNNSNTAVATEPAADDTINYTNYSDTKGSLNNLNTGADAERKQMIMTQIDSTYAAIALLDETKQDLTDMSVTEITLAERNKKSKLLFNINIIQNELIRELDGAIVNNLKAQTKTLSDITQELDKNATHLNTITQKLNKLTQTVSRLTNLLAAGLSKGFIKPATPKSVTAETVKATLQ